LKCCYLPKQTVPHPRTSQSKHICTTHSLTQAYLHDSLSHPSIFARLTLSPKHICTTHSPTQAYLHDSLSRPSIFARLTFSPMQLTNHSEPGILSMRTETLTRGVSHKPRTQRLLYKVSGSYTFCKKAYSHRSIRTVSWCNSPATSASSHGPPVCLSNCCHRSLYVADSRQQSCDVVQLAVAVHVSEKPVSSVFETKSLIL
jgi:hypothetical protein